MNEHHLMNISPCPVCGTIGNFAYEGKDFMGRSETIFTYAKCPACGLYYQNPMPGLAEIETYYPSDYSVYDRLEKTRNISFLKKAVLQAKYGYKHLSVSKNPIAMLIGHIAGFFAYKDLIAFNGGGKALDIGCGNGKFLKRLRELGWDTTGIDFSMTAVESCRALGLSVHHGTLESLNLPDGSIDLVTARHVIEHISTPEAFIKEIARILKKDGRLLIQTPDTHSLSRAIFGRHWFANDIPRHLILFSPENLDQLVNAHGLKRIYMKALPNSGFILSSLAIYLKSKNKQYTRNPLIKQIAKTYVPLSKILGMGDEIFAIYQKN